MSKTLFAASGTVGHTCLRSAPSPSRHHRTAVCAEPDKRASTKHSSETGGTAPELPATLKEGEIVQQATNPRFNYIPVSRWPKGIPPVMGAHLMGSGVVAPISTSTGAGLSTVPHMFYYPEEAAQQYTVNKFDDAEKGGQGLAEMVKSVADQSIQEHGAFTLVLSGGSLLKALGKLVGMEGVQYDKWHVFYVDERNVPHSSEDSTHKGAQEGFLGKVDIPEAQVHKLKEGLTVKQAATEYEGQLLGVSPQVLPRADDGGFAVFDLILLGVGPDGHVASLFPNRSQTAAKEGWVLPVADSPKPPSERITFTLPVINSAKHVAVVAFGEGKAEIVQRVLEVQALPGALPAQLVRPSHGSLTWMLDAGSAKDLKIGKWEDSKSFPRSTN